MNFEPAWYSALWAWFAGTDFTDWILVLLAGFLFRHNQWMKWFMGAIARHSDQQRQIAASQAGIKMTWWDPSIHMRETGMKWPRPGEHGEENQLTHIHIGIAEHDRKFKPNWWQRHVLGQF